MRSIEKALTSYIKGHGAKVSNETLMAYAEKDVNETINTLFKIINDELDDITNNQSLSRVQELFQYIHVLLGTYEEVNRKIVARKLYKLDEKIERIKVEKKKKFKNIDRVFQELDKMKEAVEQVEEQTSTKETKQYEFINYLLKQVHNITYLEYTFMKMPSLVNVKDKDDVSFFRNVINSYVDCIQRGDEEEKNYLGNVLSLVLSQRSFTWKETEKKEILEYLHMTVNKMSINKGMVKKNKDKIQEINDLIETIKEMGDKKAKIEQIAKKYNISIHFSEPLLEKVKWTIPGEEDNRVIIDDYVITIDGEGAIEIDDALSCQKLSNGNYLLGVHIASALGYFPYESDIIEEAISRNCSIYLPTKFQEKENDFNKVIPIFPYEFSAEKASLLAGSPKKTRSYYFEISQTGEIVKETFFKSITTSHKKTTYKEIDKVLEHGSNDLELQRTVQNLQAVTEILDARFKPSTLYEQVKEATDDYSDLRVKRVGAEKIVYQAMLLTGNRVANFFADKERGYPCLYRVHQVNEEDSKKLQAMIDNLVKTYGGDQYQKLYQLINGLYPKGWYGIEGSHAGLGLDHYCHCTSSLRRAADIVVEHGLEVCYDKIPTDQELQILEEEVKRRANQINSKQNPIEWFLRDYKRAYQKRR